MSQKRKQNTELILRAQKQEQSAFSEILKNYSRSVYQVIYRMVKNQEDAEDIMIETFTKAFKNIERYQFDYNFSTWIFRIATNNCIDFLRKRKLQTVSINQSMNDDDNSYFYEIADPELNPQDIAIQRQKIEILRTFVAKIPDKYQMLIELRYFKELSYQEIADELELPIGTVKAQLHRAREILIKILRNKKDKFY